MTQCEIKQAKKLKKLRRKIALETLKSLILAVHQSEAMMINVRTAAKKTETTPSDYIVDIAFEYADKFIKQESL